MGQVSFNDVVEQIPSVEEEQPQSYTVFDGKTAENSWAGALPAKQGLYDPDLEKDACGVGFAA